MPPKKDKNLAGANPVPQPVPDPYLEERNKFLETFISFVKQWCIKNEITHELNVLILKDGRYFEEIKEEVIVEQKDPASEFRYHVAEPEVIKKPYSEQFDDIELQHMSLHNIQSFDVEVTQEINIGLGFNKDGVLTKFHSEESHIPPTFMNIFVELKSIYHTITKIHLIDCNLTAHSVFILGGFLRAYHSVNDVNLDLNHVPEQNFHVLIKGTGVEYLSLKSCKIDCFGAKLIAKILTYEIGVTQNLLSLCLTGNSIHDEGLTILAQSLRCNCTLQHLSIAKNIISDYGVIELAQVLKKFPLKPHEDLDRRFSYIKYLEILELENQDDTVSNASNLGSSGSTSGTSKNVTRRSRKSKGSGSAVVPPVEPQPREQPLIWNISLSKILGSKLHPLLSLTVEEGDGKIYSVGNFSLRYLNLSYNWLTEKGVSALTEVALYQASVGTQATGTGLQYIDLEGLYTTSVGEIMPEINLLNKVLTEREIPEVLDLRHLFQSQ